MANSELITNEKEVKVTEIEAGKIYPLLPLRTWFKHFEVRDKECIIVYSNFDPRYVIRGIIIPGYTDHNGKRYKSHIKIDSILDVDTGSTVTKIDAGIGLEKRMN